MAKAKSLYNGKNYLHYTALVQSFGQPYTIKQSTYTYEIVSEFVNVFFMQNLMSEKSIIAAKMIERDIKELNVAPPVVDRYALNYYEFQPPERLFLAPSTIYGIDIKMAYATVLKNRELIKPDTFKFLCSLPKKDRLSCVGMLAANKNIMNYDGAGNLTSIANSQNAMNPYFYLCVLEVQRLMGICANLLGGSLLFYWVDCIYFDSAEKAAEIQLLLAENGFKSTFEKLTNFIVKKNQKKYVICYTKEGGTTKKFNVPKENKEVNKTILKNLGFFSEKNRIIENNFITKTNNKK